jgi:sugar/nucleoside kinase (ribokinase family)
MGRIEYLALGNPTLDVENSGVRGLGGTVVYAGLQAARLGVRTAIFGRGAPDVLGRYWPPFAQEAEMILEPSDEVTEFHNAANNSSREQWLKKWAGEISSLERLPKSAILHIAPIAQEVVLEDLSQEHLSRFVCLTPQGLIRKWDRDGGHIRLEPRRFSRRISQHVDVVVVSEVEASHVSQLLADVARYGGISVITQAQKGCQILTQRGWEVVKAEPVANVVDSAGAGDCFAAALTVALYQGARLREAVNEAVCAGAICVEGHGPGAVGSRVDVTRRAAGRERDMLWSL